MVIELPSSARCAGPLARRAPSRFGPWPGLSLGLALALAAIQPATAATPTRDQEDASLTPASRAFSTRASSPRNRYHSTLTAQGHYQITADFLSLSGDPLSLGFKLSPAASRHSVQEFGVSVAELDALLETCRAGKHCDQQEYDRHTTRYYQAKALRLDYQKGQAPRLYVDVPKVVQRNREHVRPVAAAIRRLAQEHGHDQEWMIETAIALVQGGLRYRQPSTWEDGRKILGFYPPPRALEQGYGDCDTKAALLTAILQNLTNTPIIGVHVPRHYLIGIARKPREGQAYITHRGKPYVLIETAGPARRPPGEISATTQTALNKQQGIRIDPML
jgi:hypothetical protein